jgi:hypothetical protein
MAKVADPLFSVAQRLIISLYDGGVLSPAVLERVIASIGDIAWNAASDARARDGRALPEIIVSVMMPGNALDQLDQDFAAIIAHIAPGAKRVTTRGDRRKSSKTSGTARASSQKNNDDSETSESELLEQLSAAGTRKQTRRKSPAKPSPNTRNNTTFNPLFNAAPPKKR